MLRRQNYRGNKGLTGLETRPTMRGRKSRDSRNQVVPALRIADNIGRPENCRWIRHLAEMPDVDPGPSRNLLGRSDANESCPVKLEMKRTVELSKPHYKTETASRPEATKSTSKTKVATAAAAPTPVPQIEESSCTETCVRTSICPDELRTRAFLKWEAAGKPEGDGIAFWLAAEQELQGSN